MAGQYRTRLVLQFHLRRIDETLIAADSSKSQVSSELELFYLPEFSTSQWYYERKALGRSCVELGKSSLDYKVISTGVLDSLEDDFFDLAGLFNILDHSDRPLELIRQVSQKSKVVLISGHRMIDANLQHRFANQDDTIPRLARLCGLVSQKIHFSDVELQEKWFVFALKKKWAAHSEQYSVMNSLTLDPMRVRNLGAEPIDSSRTRTER